MAGKFKIYYLNDIKHILTNFNILNPRDYYKGSGSKVKVSCLVCNSVFTKQVNRLNNNCRTCSNREKHNIKKGNKLRKLKEKFPEILRFEEKGQHYNVTFICKMCGSESMKLLPNYIKTKLCTNCSTSISSCVREENKGSKLSRVITKLNNNNEEYNITNFTDEYSQLSIKCNQCLTTVDDKIYRVMNFHRNNEKFICRECTKINKIKNSAFNMVKFYENSELGSNTGFLYMYEITVGSIKSYKIGITRNSIESRISKVSKIYDIKNIVYIEDTNLNVAKLERHLKTKYKDYKIIPENKFEGYTECFTLPILFEEKMKVQRLSH